MEVDDIQRRAESLFDEYDAKFAGKPRATRDLDELDKLIEDLEDLLAQAREKLNGGSDETLVSVVERGSENLEIYREERDAIAAVQEGGDAPVQASDLATWANAEFHRYVRHFAGENRATRDVERLNDVISSLESIADEMRQLVDEPDVRGLEEDVETVEENLEHYRDERERIHEARQSGDPDERSSLLAVAANEQFAIYNELFAGRDRVTRRPSLLRRVIRSLETIGRQMRELRDEGVAVDDNDQNIDIVEDNLAMYRDELEAVEDVREDHDAEDLTRHLGSAANAIFESYRDEYAGEDRRTRNLDQLGWMCDELYHLGRQMDSLDDQVDSGANRENLRIVLENLSLYQREYDAIVEAQNSGTVDFG